MYDYFMIYGLFLSKFLKKNHITYYIISVGE